MSPVRSVRARIDNVLIGETRNLHQISEQFAGYRILGRLSEPITAPSLAVIAVTVSSDDENEEKELGAITVQLVRERHFQHVEIISYGEHPLRTRDDIALHVHLFAVAST